MASRLPNSETKDDRSQLEGIRRLALSLLARREQSTLELRQKLMRRGCKPSAVEEALQRLNAEGLLSDARYADAYSHARLNRGYGPLRIRRELRERGVSQTIITTCLAELDNLWMPLLVRVHRKRFGATLPKSVTEQAQQVRFLSQRGFTQDQIKRLFQAE